MQIKIKALGALAKYITEETKIAIPEGVNLKVLLTDHTSISSIESNISFVVNGRVQKETYLLNEGDSVVFLRVGGAG